MDAQHTLIARRDRRIDGVQGPRDDVGRRADQGGHEAGDAMRQMRPTDGRQPLGRRLVIEQNAAAAVHLKVDQAGGQPPAVQIDHFIAVLGAGAGFHCCDMAVDDRQTERRIDGALGRQHPAVGELKA